MQKSQLLRFWSYSLRLLLILLLLPLFGGEKLQKPPIGGVPPKRIYPPREDSSNKTPIRCAYAPRIVTTRSVLTVDDSLVTTIFRVREL